MNHLACGTCGQQHTPIAGLSGLGATKKSQQAALELELARDVTQRVLAHLAGSPSLWGPWQATIVGGRRTMVDMKNTWVTSTQSVVELRVNGIFAGAPAAIREDVALYFSAMLRRAYKSEAVRQASARFMAWAQAALVAAATTKTYQRSGVTKRPDGLDLQDIYAQLVATHIRGTKFETTADWTVPRLTFGKRAKPSKRIQLGLYTTADKTITVHGNMMDERWPAYVIADTMWHEMMHYYQDATGEGLSHNAIFRVRERLFSGHKMANDWLTHNNPFVFGKDPNHVVEHPHQRGAR